MCGSVGTGVRRALKKSEGDSVSRAEMIGRREGDGTEDIESIGSGEN